MEVNEVQEQMKAVQRMQEYIEEHLEEDITLANLSEVSLFSSWHSYRLFKNYLEMTPAEYIRRLRLSHSAMRLKKEQCLVIDAAYDGGIQKAGNLHLCAGGRGSAGLCRWNPRRI